MLGGKLTKNAPDSGLSRDCHVRDGVSHRAEADMSCSGGRIVGIGRAELQNCPGASFLCARGSL